MRRKIVEIVSMPDCYQTAFLSSLDEHTHPPYQHFLREAIAIVCAPRYRDTRVLHLTPYGMDYIKECARPPTPPRRPKPEFHPHDNTTGPLHTTASHVRIVDRDVELVDLR